MKLKHYIIFSVVIVLISTTTALGGYFYGSLITKQKAELDKEAAVKGAIYDAKEQLTDEAIKQAEEVVGDVTDKNSTEAKKVLKDFFSKTETKNFEEAYKLLSADYKRSLYSASAISKEFSYAKEIKAKNIEFRSSGDTSAMFAVTLANDEDSSLTTTNTTSKKEATYFISLTKDLTESWKIENIELKDKTQNFNAAWGSSN